MNEKEEELDLESYWDDVRVHAPIRIVNTEGSNVRDGMLLAGEKTIFDLKAAFAKYNHKPLTTDMLAEMMGQAVRMFMKHWYDDLRGKDLAGLVEIVLEGQNLEPQEMSGFLRALPMTLLERIARSAIGTANGVHGLIGVEHARRVNRIADYTIAQDINGQVYFQFNDPRTGRCIRCFLNEKFELPSD
jgi:hypothetical protein